ESDMVARGPNDAIKGRADLRSAISAQVCVNNGEDLQPDELAQQAPEEAAPPPGSGKIHPRNPRQKAEYNVQSGSACRHIAYAIDGNCPSDDEKNPEEGKND